MDYEWVDEFVNVLLMSWKSERDWIKYEWTNIYLAQETSNEHGIQTTAWPSLAALSQVYSETEKITQTRMMWEMSTSGRKDAHLTFKAMSVITQKDNTLEIHQAIHSGTVGKMPWGHFRNWGLPSSGSHRLWGIELQTSLRDFPLKAECPLDF